MEEQVGKLQAAVEAENTARSEQHKIAQEQLAQLVDKKRTYISRVENDGANMTLKTLFEIVEKGLGGKVQIKIDL